MKNVNNIVHYSEFGAVGDGVTNDFFAIKAAHDKANEMRLSVMADAGAKYYIGRTNGESVTVKTDVDFLDAEFIVDDSVIEFDTPDRNAPLFIIAPESELRIHGEDSEIVKAINKAGGIKWEDKKLAYNFGYDVMLIPVDETKRVYRRLGATANPGGPQKEVVYVHADGTIDPDTPVLLNYDNVTSVIEYRVDDTPITIKGGVFTTIANAAPREYTYYHRNIHIARSNTTIDGVKHYVTDETDTGAPYHGFITIEGANRILIRNAVLTGHRAYRETSGRSYMGSYDINISIANAVTFDNCTQTNFFVDGVPSANGRIWGIMGSNYSKNLTYKSCMLTRLDAHAGVYNASVIDSVITYIRLTGGGTFKLIGSTVYGNEIISLRADYGCTWRGDVIIKDTTLVNGKIVNILSAKWQGWHNFGYQVYHPQNILIDNLILKTPADIYVYNDITPDRQLDPTGSVAVHDGIEVENVNPVIITKTIKIKPNETNLNLYGSMGEVLNSKLDITKI